MKRLIALVIICTILFAGCSEFVPGVDETVSSETTMITDITTEITVVESEMDTDDVVFEFIEDYVDVDSFTTLNDASLHQYAADNIYAKLEKSLDSEDYKVESISVRYLSEEYLTELEYNSLENVYFGYTISEIQESYGNESYVFTLGENGTTEIQIVKPTDTYFNEVVTNVAIGTGVILICVVVKNLTTGTYYSSIFASAAKTSAEYAKDTIEIAELMDKITVAISTGEYDSLFDEDSLAHSEDFKLAAIYGALNGADAAVTGGIFGDLIDNQLASSRPNIHQSEEYAITEYYSEGETEVAYLDGEIVDYYTEGASRPDLIVGNTAIEIKNYNLLTNLGSLALDLYSLISSRNINLPEGMEQEIFLDARGQDISVEQIESIVCYLQTYLFDIYPNITISYVL